MKILESSVTGNIMGFCSILLGIISIILTIRTMKTATRIEREMKEAKITALDRNRFQKDKVEYLKTLQAKRKSVSETQVLSYQSCNNVLSIINDIKGYDSIITNADMDIIKQQWDKLRQISFLLQEKRKNETVKEFDVIVSTIINILSKGEYEL